MSGDDAVGAGGRCLDDEGVLAALEGAPAAAAHARACPDCAAAVRASRRVVAWLARAEAGTPAPDAERAWPVVERRLARRATARASLRVQWAAALAAAATLGLPGAVRRRVEAAPLPAPGAARSLEAAWGVDGGAWGRSWVLAHASRPVHGVAETSSRG